jgi:hypothetical protein
VRWRRRRADDERQAAGANRPAAGGSTRPPAQPADPDDEGRPQLPDGARRAVLSRARAAEDADAALAELLAVSSSFAPDPHVLHALCLSLKGAGQETAAVAVAREALPLCFRARQGLLAAEILEAVDAEPAALGVSRVQLLALGGALAETSLWPLAVKLLAALVLRDPGDEKAIRGLLRIASHRTAQHDPAEAARIERFVQLVADRSPAGAGAEADPAERAASPVR